MPYAAIIAENSCCPGCGQQTTLLSHDEPFLPAFYICACGFIGQVGVRMIREPAARKYALCRVGTFADGEGTPCFQIFMSLDGGVTWSLSRYPENVEKGRAANDPVAEEVALLRLRDWEAP